MNQTNMLGPKMAGGASILGAITAWIPHIEAAFRIGASAVAIVAGLYAIANYHADYRRKKETKTNEKHDKSNTRTGNTGHGHRRLHDD